jgi:signal transduction histidine kinase
VTRLERFAPIRVRVTAAAGLAVLLLAVAGSLLFMRELHSSLEAGLIATSSQDIADLSAQLGKGSSPQQLVVTGGNDVVVQLLDADGKVLAGHAGPASHRPLMSAPGTETDARVPGRDDRYTIVARRTRGTGAVSLVVAGRSTEQVQRATAISLGLLSLAVPLVVALLSVTVWISIGRALRPVEAMRRQADEITSARLDRRLPIPPGSDEIPRLAVTINEMLDRIQRSHVRQRQFVSDASHELRSQLAVIRQSAEVAHSYPGRVSTADLADDVLAESRRLEDLVNALLMLARLDDAKVVTDSAPVDLDDIVLQEANRVRTVPGLTVDVSHVSAGQVRGGGVLLGQVVRNLVDNAVRHATSRIMIGVREERDWVEMTVEDDGDGIAPAERDRIFDRFVRLDSARAREEGGAGLGLAIVRNIVELAHGTVAVDSSSCGGARFTVRLPAAG